MKKVKVLLALLALNIITSCQNKDTKPSTEKPSGVRGSFQDPGQDSLSLLGTSRQISFVGPKSGEGYFSPDGSKMIFQSERSEGNPFYQMYVMDLKTGESTRVSPGVGKTTCGWIHPSMKKVLFSSTHLDPKFKSKVKEEYESRNKAVKARYSWSFDDQYEIFSSDLKGRGLRRLTNAAGYDAEASYSPDGQWIAFASNRTAYTTKLNSEDQKMFNQDPSYMMDIFIMKADGSQVRQLTQSKGYDGGPFFSADGRKITWRRFSPNGSTAEIYTMNVDGSDQKQITRLNSMSWAPFFHPSGDYVIFGSSVLGYSNFELFIVDVEGRREPVRVTHNEGFDGLPVFTPDGRQLSWTLRNEKGESQIMIADWDDVKARSLLGLKTQDPLALPLKAEVDSQDIQTWVRYLASEEMKGRGTGSAEEKLYTEKISQAFKLWGLEPAGDGKSYFQVFEFTSGVDLGSKNTLEFVGSFKKSFEVQKDFQPLSFSQVGSFKEAPLVFAGYGIKAPATDKEPEYNSYKNADVKGKWVLILSDMPADVLNARRFHLNLYSRLQHKITVAKNEGAVGVLIVSDSTSAFGPVKFEGSLSENTLPILRMSLKSSEELLQQSGQKLTDLKAKLDKGEVLDPVVIPSTYVKAQVDLQFRKSKGINVVGVLKGAGASSSLIIGAHGDHLGTGQLGNSLAKTDEKSRIHFGADDNASGMAGVMELAHSFSDKRKTNPRFLKKNVYFAIWSGEELGNLGSSHFARSIQKTKINAYLNMDMIGRLKDRLQVQGVGSGKYWTQLAEEVAVRTAVPLTIQEDPHLPTDSLAFYMAGVPTLSFFTGTHAEYHSPRDTAELIDYAGVVRVLKVVQAFAQPLIDHGQDIVQYVKVASSHNKMEGRSFRLYLGTIPDYSQEGVKGVRISGTSKDSPAEKAGLLAQDVIVQFGGLKIENLYDYVYTLQSVKPNVETSLRVVRKGQEVEVRITPRLKE